MTSSEVTVVLSGGGAKTAAHLQPLNIPRAKIVENSNTKKMHQSFIGRYIATNFADDQSQFRTADAFLAQPDRTSTGDHTFIEASCTPVLCAGTGEF